MLTSPSSVFSLLGELYMLYIFSVLSRKLGAVTKMKPYYRGYYAAMGLIVIAIVTHSLRLTSQVMPQLLPDLWQNRMFYFWLYDVPLAVAATIGFGVAVRYWGWLFRERLK